MSDSIIQIENIGKKYTLRHRGEIGKYKSIRDVLSRKFRFKQGHSSNASILGHDSQSTSRHQEDFWALRYISLEIKQGERIGIVGRNGAGKSTLLKILSRITEPTEGRIRMRGRVTSLLEVGTGFHPELTGRENIYLNGTILGMSRNETRKKFDEIVEFAEVERFLDTPVKHFSSGMYVRLAFAVAAHLEPEILIIDEVLAVGDAQFQKKCIGKIGDISQEGRTIIFVSHNLSTVEALCSRAILLNSGQLQADDKPSSVIQLYLDQANVLAKQIPLENRSDWKGSGAVVLIEMKILSCQNQETLFLRSGDDYCFKMNFSNKTIDTLKDVVISLDFFDEKDNIILLFRTSFTDSNVCLEPGLNNISCTIKNLPLALGQYRVSVFMAQADHEILYWLSDVVIVTVEGGDFFGTGSFGRPDLCKILAKSSWSATTGDL